MNPVGMASNIVEGVEIALKKGHSTCFERELDIPCSAVTEQVYDPIESLDFAVDLDLVELGPVDLGLFSK